MAKNNNDDEKKKEEDNRNEAVQKLIDYLESNGVKISQEEKDAASPQNYTPKTA